MATGKGPGVNTALAQSVGADLVVGFNEVPGRIADVIVPALAEA